MENRNSPLNAVLTKKEDLKGFLKTYSWIALILFFIEIIGYTYAFQSVYLKRNIEEGAWGEYFMIRTYAP